MSSNSESMKSKVIIERMVNETKTEEMDWIFLGVGLDDDGKKNIFMSFINLYGAKNLIMELLLYKSKNKNRLLIYMENQKTNDTISIKEIKFNEKIMKLSLTVLESVKDYLDDEEFLGVYKELTTEYKKVNIGFDSYLNYETEIAKFLFKKGDKKYWDEFVESHSFDEYVIVGWNDKSSPKEVADIILNDHDIGDTSSKKKLSYEEYKEEIIKLLSKDSISIDDPEFLDEYVNSKRFLEEVYHYWSKNTTVVEVAERILAGMGFKIQ